MASILKSPPNKGVVVFTTQERDKIIAQHKNLRNAINALKPKWVVGLHHNWHDYAFKRNRLFDFSMAGKGDLQGDRTPLIELDACNFVPKHFHISDCDKFWDILYVARNVPFKRILNFMNCVRELVKKDYKILLISATPPDVEKSLWANYNKLFNRAEKDRFMVIAPSNDYPFPYSIETLAFFYKHSKVFLHCADIERRCRVVAYAWASGMPVVCMTDPASILPKHLKKEPYYYCVQQNSQYVDKIVKAINDYNPSNGTEAAEYFSEEKAISKLQANMAQMFGTDHNNYKVANLDIRLGRHHNLATGSNCIPMALPKFVELLNNEKTLQTAFESDDPEMALCDL